MPKKKSGFPYEVHPTPVKGKDGRNIVYAKPARGLKLSMEGLDSYCAKHYALRDGELQLAFGAFLKAAAELMAQGYRIDTPIGSFVPKLKLKREITDADEVRNSDVMLDGVDYNPGKAWNDELAKWNNGFRRANNANTLELLADEERLLAVLRNTIQKGDGYVTVGRFAYHSGLTYYSARKLLNGWCEGDRPKLLKTKRGQEYIYTEI